MACNKRGPASPVLVHSHPSPISSPPPPPPPPTSHLQDAMIEQQETQMRQQQQQLLMGKGGNSGGVSQFGPSPGQGVPGVLRGHALGERLQAGARPPLPGLFCPSFSH